MAPYAEAPTLVPAGAKTMCRRQACSDCLAHRHSPAVVSFLMPLSGFSLAEFSLQSLSLSKCLTNIPFGAFIAF